MLSRIISITLYFLKPFNYVQTKWAQARSKNYLQNIHLQVTFAQSAGAVEYSDCSFAEGKDPT